MSASKPIVEHAFHVGEHMVLVTIGTPDAKTKVTPISIEWGPDEPATLPEIEQRQYTIGLRRALQALADRLGGDVVVAAWPESFRPPAGGGRA